MEIANGRVWWTRSVEGRARNSASAWVGCCDCIYIYIFVGRTSEEAPCTALASKHDTQP